MPTSLQKPVTSQAIRMPYNTRLSFNQERLWFIDQLEGSVQYHVPAILRLKGALDTEALASAFRNIVNRHEVLRTVIVQEDGIAYQRAQEKDRWQLEITDEPLLKENATALQAHVKALIDAPFDLSRDHMLRATLIILPDNEYLLVVTTHHIASDGWSKGIIIQELYELYNAYTSGREAQLPALPVQYADYAIWQRAHITGKLLDEQLAYWKRKLAGVMPLDLPADYARPAIQSNRGAVTAFRIDPALALQLARFSRQQKVTLFITLLTAFKVLLYRYSGQADICVGTPVSGRTRKEIKGLIGFFINTLSLRSDLGNDPSFLALLQQVKQTTREALDHQDAPLEKVVDQVLSSRDPGRSPVFQVIFGYQPMPAKLSAPLGEAALWEEPYTSAAAKLDLVFTIEDHTTGLTGTVMYCTDLYREETIQRMTRHFEQLLYAIINAPDTRISAFSLLTPSEEQQLLEGFNRHVLTELPAANSTVVHLFEAAAARTPEAVALVFEDSSLTYRELDERANQLAHYLKRKGVKAGALVPLCIERSLDMMVGIIGILKAGGAYVPVEADYPPERIRYLLEDTAATVIVSSNAGMDQLATDATIIALDGDEPLISMYPVTPLPAMPGNDHLAYVIYTSGSTGNPKGVMITHRNLADYVSGLCAALPLKECHSYGLLSSIATDLGNTVIYAAVTSGAALHLFSKAAVNDADLLAQYFAAHTIDCIKIVPAHWKALSATGSLLLPAKLLIFGGETLEAAVVEQIRSVAPACIVVNHYGPTETTIGKLLHIVQDDINYNNIIPIGKPFSNTVVYVLDAGGQLCPVGVPGELYIGGEGVASGYLHHDALTASRFIANPFLPAAGSRLYRTGDQVKYLPDGNVVFLGRTDDQVKIRGYRVEPGEIERALNRANGVSQGTVVVRTDSNGNKRLIAYVAASEDLDQSAVLAYLREQLPEHMVPALLVVLDHFPLMANGKIDRKALPDPDTAAPEKNAYVAPRNELEQTLANIWEAVLGVERVGIHDNFFELGGDSIITIQVVSRARRSGYELQVGDLFDYQTIATLYTVLSARKGMETAVSGEQAALTGSSGLLPVQQWFFETEDAATSHFNQSVLLAIDKRVDTSTLSAAITRLLAHHDSLRFVYSPGEQGWEQAYGAHEGGLTVVDMLSVPPDQLKDMLATYGETYQRSLNITTGVLFRAVLFVTQPAIAQNRLLLIIHHLAVDGVSWRILLDDLASMLDNLHAHTPVSLGRKGSAYRDWYQALVNYSQSARLLQQQDYWAGIKQHYLPVKPDKQYEGPLHMPDIATCQVRLDAQLTRQLLQEAPRAYHTEINDLLLCALAKTLCIWAGGNVVIGLEGHGREHISRDLDISNTVGWFTSLYPVLLQAAAEQEPGALLREVKEQLRQVPDKGIGYGVLKYMHKAAALQGNDPWDITFNYLGQFDATARGNGWFTPADEYAGATIGDHYTVRRKLAINSMVTDGTLVLDWSYSQRHFNAATMQQLAENYLQALTSLVLHAAAKAGKPVFTPSDYGLGGLVSNAALDDFLDTQMVTGGARREQVTGLYRLSGLQEGMLFHGLYDGAAGAYTNQFTYQLQELDASIFLQSWQHLLQRHSILRSAFYPDVFSVPVQCVYRDLQIPVTRLDYRGMSEAAQEQAWTAFEAAERKQGFDFEQPPLMRIALIQLQEAQYRMVWTFHHLLLDGWSLPVLMEELLQTYELLATGRQPAAVEEDRYEDYIRYLERRDKEQEAAYWQQYLSGINTPALLPFIHATTERTKGKGHHQTELLMLEEDQVKRITAFARQNRLTVNTLMQGVWAYLLYRYTGSAHITYGVTVSGRPDDLPDVEKRVGMYINTLPLHAVVDRERGIVDWLRQLQQEQVQSRRYQHTPLNDSQRYAGINGDLFDTLLVFENYPVNKVTLSGAWRLQAAQLQIVEHTNYPLSVSIDVAAEIRLVFIYNTALLPQTYVQQLSIHFTQALEQLLAKPGGKLDDWALFSAGDRQLLPVELNNPATAYPPQADQTLTDLFAAQVRLHPDSTAVLCGQETLTYQELDIRSNQVAQLLMNSGVTAGSNIGLLAYRGPEMIIGIWGILKSGCAYVPLHTGYPAERLVMMVADAGISQVLYTDEALFAASGLAAQQGIPIAAAGACSGAAVPVKGATNACAYVMYTSGTTGRPKGIGVSHQNIIQLVFAPGPIAVLPEDTVLQWSNYAFDGATYDIYGALLHGARLCMIPEAAASDVFELAGIIKEQEVSVCFMTTALFNNFADSAVAGLQPLRKLLFGGEMVSVPHVENALSVLGPGKLVHMYGPTETTVYATCFPVDVITDGVIPIGKPLASAKIMILDDHGALAPMGINGELYIGGDGVSQGYINNDNLTAEKFLSVQGYEGRWYRTGDIGHRLPDGNIVYTGRKDNQVKIRGYRVEPGEIEQVLQQCALVSQAVVLARADNNGHKRLTGYVLPAGDFNRDGIMAWLREKLPEYMIPAQLVAMDKWPLNANGKIDRQALPDPDAAASLTNAYAPPRNEAEQALAVIWAALLGVQQVGIYDNFFELEGDSILSIQAVSRAKRLGYVLQPRDLFLHQTIAGLSTILSRQGEHLTPGEQALLNDNSPGEVAGPAELDRFMNELVPTGGTRKDHISALYRLSSLQEGMLFHGLYDNAAGAYTEQFTCCLHDPDVAVFLQSWEYLLQRHSILRSAFYHDVFRVPVQCVYRSVQIPVSRLDYQGMSPAEQETAWTAFEAATRNQGFDFTQPPLMRIALIQLSSTEYRMVWTFHHLLLDGWSMPVCMSALLQTYEQLMTGREPAVVEEDCYEDYIRYLESRDKEQEAAWWKQYLSGTNGPTLLPFIDATLERSKGKGVYGTCRLLLDAGKTSRITAFARQQRLTVNTLMQGVWAYLLYRYTGNEHITYGVTVSGRPDDLPGVEKRVGMYINTLPLHTVIAEDRSISGWLQQLQQEQAQCRRYQHTPLSDAQRWSGISGALFDTLLVFENYPVNEMVLSPSWRLRVSEPHMDEHTNYPISLTISIAKEISIAFKHNTELLAEGYVIQLSRHFEQVLQQVINLADGYLEDIELLSAEDLQLFERFNATAAAYPPQADQTLPGLFAAQVQQWPDSIAIAFENEQLTYRELDERSWQLAHYLRSRCVLVGTLVPVCMDRSPGIIVSMLGILKAGGAYVPVDPGYPAARISDILADCGADVVLSNNACRSKLPAAGAAYRIIALDEDWSLISENPSTPFPTGLTAGELAYVIYTSGSTGTPKGVMVTHSGVLNLVHWHIRTYEVSAHSKATAVAGIGFDAFGWEVWPYLLSGATVLLLSDAIRLATTELVQVCINKSITHSFLPTGLVPAFIAESRNKIISLQYLLTGGDQLPPTDTSGLTYRLVNNYGPTENSVVTTYYPLHASHPAITPPIGKPVSNTKIYITDSRMRLVPLGVAGEICIAGAGLARGYLHREELTAQQFVEDPFGREGGRLYRSGDLGRWLPDGNIVYLGRKDEQVKIRGYRVELGEIEQVLQQCALVSQAVVLARADDKGHRRLIAYVVPEGAFKREAILAHLQERLPGYMVPALLMELEQLPLTANGKIDRQALPDPGAGALPTNNYVAPRNEAELALAGIWEALLGIERVGIHDNFFELGGDSVLSIQVVSRAKSAGYALQPKDLFLHQTVAGLAAALSSHGEQAITAEQGLLSGSSGLLPVQQWFFETAAAGVSHFNHSFLLAIDKDVDVAVLSAAVAQLVAHHDSLRFVYGHGAQGWEQLYGSCEGVLTVADLQAVSADDVKDKIAAEGAAYQCSLNIRTGELFRAVLFLTPDAVPQNRLLLIIHHLAVDGVSWRILLDDLGSLVDGLQKQQPVSLGRKGSAYRDWYQALLSYGQSARLLQQQDYWAGIVQQYQPLKVDNNYDGILKITDMGNCQVKLGQSLTRRLLQEAPRAYHTEINDVLLSALTQTLCSWAGGAVVIGLEGHGREDISKEIDLSRTVGWFTSLYPVLLDEAGVAEPGALLKTVKAQLRRVPDKGLGYGVLKYLNKAAVLQGNDPWEITFNYLGQFDATVRRKGWFTAADEYAGPTTGDDYTISRKLSVNSMVAGGELKVDWSYSRHHFNAATVQQLAERYIQTLEGLIAHMVDQAGKPVLAPSDYGPAGKHLLPLNNGREDNAVFLLPGQPGLSEGYDELALALQDAGLIYGLQMPGVYEGEISPDNIPAMAAQCISWMQQRQPVGPYRLIAHSFGGYVAFEMARQLAHMQEKVEYLVILDAVAHLAQILQEADDAAMARFLFATAAAVLARQNIAAKLPMGWLAVLAAKVEGLPAIEVLPCVTGFIQELWWKEEQAHLASVLRLLHLATGNIAALEQYSISVTLETALIVVKTADTQQQEPDAYLGWLAHAAQVKAITAPGDHLSMVKGENAVVLSQYLAEQLTLHE